MELWRKKILIVDDNEAFIMYVAILLKRMGFAVIPAENGMEAIKLLKMMRPDMIMIDIYMPVMDGINLLRNIKNDQQICNIPSVMITVETNQEVMKKCKELGSAGYLKKPIKIDKLHEILQECIFSPIGTQRKYLRIEFNRKVTLICDDTPHVLYAETLSEGGLYVRTKQPVPVGSEVRIRLPLRGTEYLDLKGVVIYIKGLFGDLFRISPGMAIEFRHLSERDSLKIKQHIMQVLASDILESQEEPIIERDHS